MLALAFTGPNTWWYTNNWGVPFSGGPVFWDGWPFGYGLTAPSPVYTLCLLVAILLLVFAGSSTSGARRRGHRSTATRTATALGRLVRGRGRPQAPARGAGPAAAHPGRVDRRAPGTGAAHRARRRSRWSARRCWRSR